MYASTDGCARYILLHAAEVTEWHMYLTTDQSVHTHKNIIIIIAAVYKRLEVNSDFVNGADLCVYRAPCSSWLLISFQYAGQRYRRDGFAHRREKTRFFSFSFRIGFRVFPDFDPGAHSRVCYQDSRSSEELVLRGREPHCRRVSISRHRTRELTPGACPSRIGRTSYREEVRWKEGAKSLRHLSLPSPPPPIDSFFLKGHLLPASGS